MKRLLAKASVSCAVAENVQNEKIAGSKRRTSVPVGKAQALSENYTVAISLREMALRLAERDGYYLPAMHLETRRLLEKWNSVSY